MNVLEAYFKKEKIRKIYEESIRAQEVWELKSFIPAVNKEIRGVEK